MATRLAAEIRTAGLRRRLERIPAGYYGALKAALALALAKFFADYTARRLTTYNPGTSVQQRTGTLARALSFETTGDRLATLKGRVFFDRSILTTGTIGGPSDTTYAHVHEYGATITPKRAQWLTIPVAEALTPAGVARGTIRDFPEGFFFRANEDTLEGLFFVREVGDRLEFLFHLVKKVTIKESLHFRDDWKAFFPELIRFLSKASARFIADWNQGRDHG